MAANSPVTITSNSQVALLPDPSVNVYITVVVPLEKDEFGVCELVRDGVCPELSVAEGIAHETNVDVTPVETVILLSLGQLVTVGGTVSDGVVAEKMMRVILIRCLIHAKSMNSNSSKHLMIPHISLSFSSFLYFPLLFKHYCVEVLTPFKVFVLFCFVCCFVLFFVLFCFVFFVLFCLYFGFDLVKNNNNNSNFLYQ